MRRVGPILPSRRARRRGAAPAGSGPRLVPHTGHRHGEQVLVVVSGLPGTGKTAVAAELAARLGAVHLSVDPIEDALLGAGLPPSCETGVAAYEAARAVAEQNLALGLTVVAD